MIRQLTRRTFVPAALFALAGCGSDGDGGEGGYSGGAGGSETATATPAENPVVGDVEQRGDLGLASPAFEDGGQIPQSTAIARRTSTRRCRSRAFQRRRRHSCS